MTSNEPTLTRRQVLAGTLGVAGLAALRLTPRIQAAEASTSGMYLGCGTVSFRTRPLEEALERIRRAGYEYVETQATGPWCPHVDVWKDDPEQFRRQIQKVGFRAVTGLWSPNGAIIPDAKSVEGISQAVRWAKAAGIPVVHCGDGSKPQDLSDEAALALLGQRLAKILEVAAEYQVYVAIEPHGAFSLTAEGLQRILALSPSPWLGINYDTANVHRATYVETMAGAYHWKPFGKPQNEVETLQAVANRVVHVHVKDVVGDKCVALGEGKVNLRGCLQVLQSAGYRGVLSLETEGEFGPDEGQVLIERSRQFLSKTLAELTAS